MKSSVGCKMAELEPIKDYNCTKTAIYISSASFAKKFTKAYSS